MILQCILLLMVPTLYLEVAVGFLNKEVECDGDANSAVFLGFCCGSIRQQSDRVAHTMTLCVEVEAAK